MARAWSSTWYPRAGFVPHPELPHYYSLSRFESPSRRSLSQTRAGLLRSYSHRLRSAMNEWTASSRSFFRNAGLSARRCRERFSGAPESVLPLTPWPPRSAAPRGVVSGPASTLEDGVGQPAADALAEHGSTLMLEPALAAGKSKSRLLYAGLRLPRGQPRVGADGRPAGGLGRRHARVPGAART